MDEPFCDVGFDCLLLHLLSLLWRHHLVRSSYRNIRIFVYIVRKLCHVVTRSLLTLPRRPIITLNYSTLAEYIAVAKRDGCLNTKC